MTPSPAQSWALPTCLPTPTGWGSGWWPPSWHRRRSPPAGFTEAQITAAYQPEHFYLTEEGFVFWIQGNDLPALHSPVEVTLSFDSLADLRHG